MVIPNMVMKFKNVDIFYKFVKMFTCHLHSPAAWKALRESHTFPILLMHFDHDLC